MRNTLAVAGLFATFGIACAVPARPLYEPERFVPPPARPSLVGTTWIGKLFVDGSRVTFKPGGALEYGEGGSVSPGTWRLEEDTLYFDINQYSEYKTIVKGDTIEGIGWNKSGMKCTPLLRRSNPDQAPLPQPPKINEGRGKANPMSRPFFQDEYLIS